MDLVLELADTYLLDDLYARLLPVSAFATSVNSTLLNVASSLNASFPVLSADKPAVSAWSHIVSYIPHPPLPAEVFEPAVASAPLVSAWPRDYIPRQLLSLLVLTLIGIHLLYFSIAGLSYRFIFNHEMMKHPKFLKNQVKLEIQSSLRAFPMMTVYTIPWFVGECRGYSKLYTDVSEYGWGYFFFSIAWYVSQRLVNLHGKLIAILGSWYSRTTAFTGFTAGSTIPSATSGCTSRTTNGSVRHAFTISPHFPIQTFSLFSSPYTCTQPRLLIFPSASSHSLRLPRLPPARRIPPVHPLPPIHLPLPTAPETLSGSVLRSQLLEYLRKFTNSQAPLRSLCLRRSHNSVVIDPRLGHDHWTRAREGHQRSRTPYTPPSVLHSELRPGTYFSPSLFLPLTSPITSAFLSLSSTSHSRTVWATRTDSLRPSSIL